jgi:hypothetical protein
MALVHYGPLIDDIAGPIGGTTFTRTLAGPATKRRPNQVNPSSEAQSQARNTLDHVAKAWLSLTKTQQAQWQLAANAHPLPNRLGRYRTTTGFALWCQLGVNLLNAGQTLNDTPPSIWTSPSMFNPGVRANLTPEATTDIFASWNRRMLVDSVITIKATPPTPWGKTPQRSQLRTIATIAPDSTTPLSLISAWSAVYGTPPQTTPYQILWEFTAYSRDTGAQMPWIDYVQSNGGPNPADPPAPTTDPSTAPTVAESLNLIYAGSTTTEQWIELATTPNVEYTVIWTSSDATGNPTIWFGPNSSTLAPFHDLAQTDAFTFTAKPNTLYYLASGPWATTNDWQTNYAPTQTTLFATAKLTADATRTRLIDDATNLRLLTDIAWQNAQPPPSQIITAAKTEVNEITVTTNRRCSVLAGQQPPISCFDGFNGTINPISLHIQTSPTSILIDFVNNLTNDMNIVWPRDAGTARVVLGNGRQQSNAGQGRWCTDANGNPIVGFAQVPVQNLPFVRRV